MQIPRVTLEQWAVLKAVVEEGSYARAAEALNRSQSSVSYTLRALQEQLPVKVLRLEGRKAQLTEAGAVLLRRAGVLLEEACNLDALATNLAQGWEAEVRLAVEIIFPTCVLLDALARFAPESRSTRVQLLETVLSGTHEALLRREADLAIIANIPPGFLGQPLLAIEFIAVAHPEHPLHQLGRELTGHDLQGHRQLVIRDSGLKRKVDAGWLGAEQRWTVSNLRTSIDAVGHGLGFAWLPREHIRPELAAGRLKPLPLREGGSRQAQLYLVFADRDGAGLATRALAEALLATCREAERAE
ncbi:MAG: LysR family transcriptional regulator [Spongiibacteraceae bacterium]|jgi:DNA-binding transcriptional LysR family regulator|nr:LysR family transcriptional regulator [Spongiibacteraceae bacterium]